MSDTAQVRDTRHAGSVLKASDIWFSYDGRTPILQGAGVEVKDGLLTMMLGRSGSGKTTLLKIMAGLLKPDRGTVDFSALRRAEAGGRDIAYIPQNLGLVRGLTVMDNVAMGALGQTGTFRSLLNLFPREVYRRARQIVSDLGIAAKLDRKIWDLSGGERQRVAIARALIQRPKVILADEFVSQLDPVTSMEILALMKGLADNRTAFLITTHDVDLVGKYADRVIIMKNGRVTGEHCPAIMLAGEILEEMR
jgi:phosphonate transport system ATP-binding protein